MSDLAKPHRRLSLAGTYAKTRMSSAQPSAYATGLTFNP
jgi:hypothetical protein